MKRIQFVIRRMLVTGAIAWMPFVAQSMDSTEVLPAGIHSPAIRMGVISGIGQKYTSDGSLISLGDDNSVEFSTPTLIRIEPRVADLVAVLNQFGRQNLGDALHLGVLRVNTEPQVRYIAPLHAYGVTENWTVAFGVPILFYKNQLHFSHQGSNLDAIREQIGSASREINDAFDQLGGNLVTAANKELASKGYKPVSDRDETLIGDLQLVSLYRFHKSDRWQGQFKTILNFPTGSPDDPDDLADLGLFGETAIEQMVLVSANVFRPLTVSMKAGYRHSFRDKVEVRVPTAEDDMLPGPETKEKVSRDLGSTVSFGVSGTYAWTERWSTALGYEASRKGADAYSGEMNSNYSLLERDTASSSHKVRLGLSYDTVSAYLSKKALFPSVISFELSDVFRGTNTERQTVHEIWWTLFF